ncbi:MAG: response regulator transcription factor [Bacteroides sp.]|nr:response regulator transcription factor [Bacteroides sp.]
MTIDRTKGYVPSNIMKDLIRDNNLLLHAISRFDISFGFGDNTVEQTCRDNNVDVKTFLCVCNLLSGYDYEASEVSLTSLMGYLKRAHTSFLDITLPKIRHHLIDAINYNDSNEVALLLIRFYDDYVVEVRKHMEHENDVIFRYVEKLMNDEVDPDFSISMYSESHDDTVTKLNDLKDIFIYHYQQKDIMRLSGTLLDIIICEKDLLSHFDVETKLFIPLVEKLEKEKRTELTEHPDGGEDESADTPATLLSEREKDIIRGIAQGKSNKEIADELNISVHTVATHRRNISTKLDIHSAAGITIFAIIHHLVDVNEVTPS